MSDDWDDSVTNGASNGDDVERGRSFGKGRGFVPQSIDNFSSGGGGGWDSNFSGRGSGWNSDSGGRRGERRGGFRGNRGGGSHDNDDRRGRFGNDGDRDDDDRFGNRNDRDDDGGGFGSNRGFDNENRRGRGGGRGRGGFDDDRGGSSWKSNDNDEEDDADGGEKKPEPVTYIPEERTEDDLFSETGIAKGINFDDYENIQVNVNGDNVPKPINSFQEAQFRDLVLNNLKKCKYDKPTPIQKYAVPIIMNGRDLMATAQTGSGKTAAFLLPIIHTLLSEKDETTGGSCCSPGALIVSPTRELAIQIKDNAKMYTSQSFLRVEILYGGVATRHQGGRISKGVNILIATPGRLMDFLNRGWVKFDSIKFVVLDEADRMLDMGFLGDIEKIMNHETMTPKAQRQTLMFSATFSNDIQRLASKFLDDYVFVAVGIVGGACKDVEQNFIQVPNSKEKKKELITLLHEQSNLSGTLLFVEQKRQADFLASFLSEKDLKTTSIHGDRQQHQREEALRDFKSGRMSILVATNVAARGLDISGVKHVINYDLPKEIDEYVHRIGRTGRLGNKGKATSFYDSSTDQNLASNLVRILKQADQKVPSFLEQDATGVGDYDSGAFGGYDVRSKGDDDGGFKTDSRNQPQEIPVQEDW